jgi:hypothetical protein
MRRAAPVSCSGTTGKPGLIERENAAETRSQWPTRGPSGERKPGSLCALFVDRVDPSRSDAHLPNFVQHPA